MSGSVRNSVYIFPYFILTAALQGRCYSYSQLQMRKLRCRYVIRSMSATANLQDERKNLFISKCGMNNLTLLELSFSGYIHLAQ